MSKKPQYNGNDYKKIGLTGHPNANKRGCICEHVLRAANALGKPLPKGAVVHHADGGFFGGQLVICQDTSYHKLLHLRQDAYEATGDPEKRKCTICKEWDDIDNLCIYYRAGRQIGMTRHPNCINEYNRIFRRSKRMKNIALLNDRIMKEEL